MSETIFDVKTIEGAYLPDIANAINGFQKAGWTVVASPIYQTKNLNIDDVDLIDDNSKMLNHQSFKGLIRHKYDCVIYLKRAPQMNGIGQILASPYITTGHAGPVQLKLPGGLQ